MKNVLLKPGYECNQECSFCKAGKLNINLNLDEIKKRIDKISESGFSSIYLSGGEVTIRDDFFEIIDYIKEKGMRYGLATNMIMFSNQEFVKKIKNNLPNVVFGSLYSINRKTDEEITQKNTYKKRILGLDNIIKNKIDLVVDIVLNKINIQEIGETIAKLNEKGVQKICIGLVKSNDEEIRQKFLPETKDIETFLLKIKKLCLEKNISLFLDNFPADAYMGSYGSSEYNTSLNYLKITHSFEPFETQIKPLEEKKEMQKADMNDYKSLGLLRITKKCNQNCIFCNVFDKVGEKFQPTLDEINNELERLKKEGVEGIVISGGEPTLNRNIGKIIDIIKEKGFKEIHIQTNAMLFAYEEFMKLGIHKKIDFFLVPLYSHEEKISDAFTRTPGSYNITINGIKNLIQEKRKVVVNHVIANFNYKNLIDFCKFYFETFGNNALLSFSYLQPNGRAKGRKDLVPKMSEVSPYLNEALAFLVSKKIEFKLAEGCPPVCFEEKYKNYHGEYEKLIRKKKDYLTGINRMNKVKAESCKECVYDNCCLGVWNHYKEMYGTDELKPIK